MEYPDDEFVSCQQDSGIRTRQKELFARIRNLLQENGMSANDADFNSGRISESWEIMMRICRYIENLAAGGTLCDKAKGAAIAFSPEALAEIVHLEANLQAFKNSVAVIGDLAEKSASNYRK